MINNFLFLFKDIVRKLFELIGFKIITQNNFIIELNNKEKEIINSSSKYTLTPIIRMWALTNATKYILKNKIKGDFVECGIYKGGNIILIKKIIDLYKKKKNIFCYDTFAGMTSPGIWDNNSLTKINATKNFTSIRCECSLEEVKNNITRNIKSIKNIKFIKGPVEKTLLKKTNLPKNISLLRLDTDFYESTKIELKVLYPLLSKGGVLIIDDYGHWEGSRKAVDEFFKGKNVLMHYVDYACRLIVK